MASLAPREVSGLRACTRCHLILSADQLRTISKCPNCEEKPVFSKRFKGIVSVIDKDGEESYVYRLLATRLDVKQLLPGAYAIEVEFTGREENLEG